MKFQKFTVRGTQYESMTQLANSYGLNVKTVSRRIKAGWNVEQAIGLNPPPKREATNGATLATSKGTYKSVREASKASGVAEANIHARLKLGWNADQACGYDSPPKRESNNSQKTVCAGKSYASKTALATAYNLSPRRVAKRLRNGWTPEQAVGLEEPPPRYRNADGSARNHSWVNPVRTKEGKLFAGSGSGRYLLYVIENSMNDKKYIGITTTSLATRFYQHKLSAKTASSTASKLYNAINKIGIENFSIRLLRDDANSIEQLLDQEVQAIREMQTLNKGYNASSGGTLGTARAIDVGGLSFESIGQAAAHFGIDPTVFGLRLNRLGWTPEEAAELVERETFGRRNKQFVIVHGGVRYEFESIPSAANHFNVKTGTVRARLKAGWSISEACTSPVKKTKEAVNYQGQSFSSLRKLAAVLDVSYQSLSYYKRNSGLALEDIIFILVNDLGKEMQRVMVSDNVDHKSALRKIRES